MHLPLIRTTLLVSALSTVSPACFADDEWNRAIDEADSALASGDYAEAKRRLTSALRRARSFGTDD